MASDRSPEELPGETPPSYSNESTAPQQPSPHGAGVPRPIAVPWTFWLWAAIIVIAYLVPRLAGTVSPSAETAQAAGLSARDFERYVQTESNARLVLSSLLAGGTSKQRQSTRKEVIQGYRSLARSTGSPRLARRALIAAAALDSKPDPKQFETLQTNLRGEKVPPEEITAELALWRSLYGNAPPIRSPGEVTAAETQIRSFDLGLFEDRALSDLYEKAGQKERATNARERLSQKAQEQSLRLFSVLSLMLLAGLAGLAFLGFFVYAWARGNWHRVGRVATAPQRFGMGDLLDAFAFYLALVRGVGLVLGAVKALDSASPLVLMSAVYIGTGVGAAAYLWWRARRIGASLADIGLRSPGGLLADIGYGIAGYCAAVPLVAGMGFLARLIFREQLSTTTTPNPILPLMAGEQDMGARLLIFLLVAVSAPLLEELFFRGALFTAFRTRYGWVASALISGALFAAMHPMSDWPQIFALGSVLATVREMRQSLVPGIVAHFLQNSIAFLMMSLIFSPS